MSIGDVYILSAQWRVTAGNLTAQNSWAFRQVGALIFDTPGEDLVDCFQDIAESAYRACVSSVYGITNYAVKIMPDDLTVYEQAVGDFSGTLSGDQLAPQLSGIISWRTSKLGRRGKGRTFMPPAVESMSGGVGTPSTPYIEACQAFADYLLQMKSSIVEHAGWELGVWSAEDQEFSPVVGYIVRYKWATRRSRAS